MYSTSETPFSAFCHYISRSYQEYRLDVTFCSEETFVWAWFAFVQLQEAALDNKMQCPTCGPSPKVVIADGVSLATQHTE
jgi:hypothetical protein